MDSAAGEAKGTALRVAFYQSALSTMHWPILPRTSFETLE